MRRHGGTQPLARTRKSNYTPAEPTGGGRAILSEITAADLQSAITGDPSILETHLCLVDRDAIVDGCSVKVHCHHLTIDANGKVQPARLVAMMRNAIADYAMPKERLRQARARDAKFNSTEAVTALQAQAAASFSHIANSGEGGELLLFLLAERFLKLPQIICKMSLKSSRQMHYHGADGVYAGVGDNGILKLYWGESKIHGDAAGAIRDCLKSLAPLLAEPEHAEATREQDLFLLSDNAELNDDRLTTALKRYFDKDSPESYRVEYCGVALAGFDASFYPAADKRAVSKEISEAAVTELAKWKNQVRARLELEKLSEFEIHFFCLPLPSADGFRNEFLKSIGAA